MSSNIDIASKPYVFNCTEVIDLIENIEERLEKIGSRFNMLKHQRFNDSSYCEVWQCLRDIAKYLREYKNGLKKYQM